MSETTSPNGSGLVELPFALERNYPNANKELAWRYIFPSGHLSTAPRHFDL